MTWTTMMKAGVAVLVFLPGCASVPVMTAETKCIPSSNGSADTAYEVLMISLNPKGISTPTQTISHVAPANGDCSVVVKDDADKPVYMTGDVSTGKDVRASAIEAVSAAPAAAVGGIGAAAVSKNGSCKGAGCSGGSPIMVTAVAGSSSVAEVAGTCPTGTCYGGSPDDDD